MFTMLLISLIALAWLCNKAIEGFSKVKDSIGDPHDTVARLNGQFHQSALDAKKVVAKGVVQAKHAPEKAAQAATKVTGSVSTGFSLYKQLREESGLTAQKAKLRAERVAASRKAS